MFRSSPYPFFQNTDFVVSSFSHTTGDGFMIWLPLSSASPSTALKLELSLSLPPRNTLLLFIIGSTPVLHFQRLQVFPSGRGPVFSAGQSCYWSLAWDLCRTESELSHEWSMRHWPPVPWLYSCWGGLNCHAPGRSVEFCVSAPPPTPQNEARFGNRVFTGVKLKRSFGPSSNTLTSSCERGFGQSETYRGICGMQR